MTKFNMTEDDFKEQTRYFDVGEYKVGINSAMAGVTDGGKEYIAFKVSDLNDPETEGEARVWLNTEKSCKYATSIMQGIASHNAKTDEDKEKVKKAFLAVSDSDELKKMCSKFTNMEAFIQVYEDESSPKPNGGYYKRTNIYGYMPSPKKTTVEQVMGGGDKVDLSEIPFN